MDVYRNRRHVVYCYLTLHTHLLFRSADNYVAGRCTEYCALQNWFVSLNILQEYVCKYLIMALKFAFSIGSTYLYYSVPFSASLLYIFNVKSAFGALIGQLE